VENFDAPSLLQGPAHLLEPFRPLSTVRFHDD